MSKQARPDKAVSLETPAEQRAHVHKILEKLDDVMFLSYASVGEPPALTARPLHVTRLDDDGTLWFMVGHDSTKVEQIERQPQAIVTAQDRSRWIHLSGRAVVVRDRARIRELWHKLHEAWFPDGPDDPNVCLIAFRPEHAEYWDNSGAPGVKYLFSIAKGLITGTGAEPVKGVHGAVGSSA
jgi:general stress protein 26